MARKKIRDAIAELSDVANQRSLDLGQAESAGAFNFQALAEELRRASQAKRGANGRAAPRKNSTRASRSADSDTGDTPESTVKDGAQAPAATMQVEPDPTAAEASSDRAQPSSDDEREYHPLQEGYRVANRANVSLAIVNPLRIRSDDVHPGGAAIEPTIDASDAVGESSTTDERAFVPDAVGRHWPRAWNPMMARLSAALGSGSRQFALLLLVPVLLAGLGSGAVSALSPTVYGARSEIVFSLRDMGWDLAERFLATQLVIAESGTTLAPVAGQFSMRLSELRDDLHVDVVRSSGVMRIEYRHTDAATAEAVVKTITDRYLVALREFEQVEGGSHRLLTPAQLLEDPIGPKPLRAFAIGALAGLAIAAAALVLRTQLAPPRISP